MKNISVQNHNNNIGKTTMKDFIILMKIGMSQDYPVFTNLVCLQVRVPILRCTRCRGRVIRQFTLWRRSRWAICQQRRKKTLWTKSESLPRSSTRPSLHTRKPSSMTWHLHCVWWWNSKMMRMYTKRYFIIRKRGHNFQSNPFGEFSYKLWGV